MGKLWYVLDTFALECGVVYELIYPMSYRSQVNCLYMEIWMTGSDWMGS